MIINRKPLSSANIEKIWINVDGIAFQAIAGETVATALVANGFKIFRYSPRDNKPRGPFCLMGSCQECIVRIDGAIMNSCLTPVREGMNIEFLVPAN